MSKQDEDNNVFTYQRLAAEKKN